MVVDEAMIVAGIGCRKGVSAEAVLAAIDGVLSHHSLAASKLDALATVPLKGDEAGIRAAAERMGLGLVVPTDEALRAVEADTLSFSDASIAVAGTASASEAAALAAAGHGARLLGPRVAIGPVTCAIAVGDVP